MPEKRQFQADLCPERCVDIAGVASSILATPTWIFARPVNDLGGLFLMPESKIAAKNEAYSRVPNVRFFGS